MPRDRSGEPLLGVRLSRPFAGTVERAAASEGLSKSDLTRRALVAYVLHPDGSDG